MAEKTNEVKGPNDKEVNDKANESLKAAMKGPGPGDNRQASPKAEPAVAVKAVPVEETGPDPADGDVESLNLTKYAEPKGTRHTDQFNTAFPEEVNTVRPA